MYSRSFGEPAPETRPDPFGPGIRSDGQLYNMQSAETERAQGFAPPPPPPPPAPHKESGLLGGLRGALGRFGTDDLLLIAVGLLILLDGDESNDVILVFILALLFL